MQIHVEYTGFEQSLFRGEAPLTLRIYDGEGEMPVGFNAVRIALDGSDSSLLNWEKSVHIAREHIHRGALILWDLRLDLLEGSLEDDARFLTLQLSVQHFVDTIWPEFRESSCGICLYSGSIAHQSLEYLKMLAALLPEEALTFLFLDTSALSDPIAYFQLTSLEKFGHFRLALKGPLAERFPYALPALGWGHTRSPLGFCAVTPASPLPQCRIEHAILLPERGGEEEMGKVIALLGERPFRVIPESLLTHEWDGIEKLVIFPAWLDERGWRKIRGFSAAGGEVINFPDDGASLQPPQISPLASLAAWQ